MTRRARTGHSVASVALAAVALPLAAIAAVLEALCDRCLLWGRVAVLAYAVRDRTVDPLFDRIEHHLTRLAAHGHRPPRVLRPLVDETKLPVAD